MKYTDIQYTLDETHFIYNNEILFGKKFIKVLKFHKEGLAAVCDETGWYHIDLAGNPLYDNRYQRAFGYYDERAAVTDYLGCFHIDIEGKSVYDEKYDWCGNYQEKVCVVRNAKNQYSHIDMKGDPLYSEKYRYAGDFKDGFACVCLQNGFFKHIDKKGNFLNDKQFVDLGVFHKGIATAKDDKGWFHINIEGTPLYANRFQQIEVFYNGFAIVDSVEHQKMIINEQGETVVII